MPLTTEATIQKLIFETHFAAAFQELLLKNSIFIGILVLKDLLLSQNIKFKY